VLLARSLAQLSGLMEIRGGVIRITGATHTARLAS